MCESRQNQQKINWFIVLYIQSFNQYFSFIYTTKYKLVPYQSITTIALK